MSGASGPEVGYVLAVGVVAAFAVFLALRHTHPCGHHVLVFSLMVVLAIGFEEIARRAARLQLRLSRELKRDMVSVWAIAGAVALDPATAAVLLLIVLTYIWFRQQRPAGEPLYRKWFNGSTEMLGALLAGVVFAAHGLPWSQSPHTEHRSLSVDALGVIVAIVVYTVVNRSLVTVAILMVGGRGRALLGSLDDNLIELATLCLGGLVALAGIFAAPLTVLVIAPMYALQRGALVRELETAAMTDSKTGLLNAIAWEQLAQRELARAERQAYSVAVIIIDIDRFKTVNDRFGHLVGDQILRGLSRTMAGALREYDTLGRFGGEEFVAVLPDVDQVTAMAIAERVREHVARLRVSQVVDGLHDVVDDNLAVSIGVALSPIDGRQLPELLHGADRALYRAKGSGRNRVVLAGPGDSGIAELTTRI